MSEGVRQRMENEVRQRKLACKHAEIVSSHGEPMRCTECGEVVHLLSMTQIRAVRDCDPLYVALPEDA